MNEPTVQVCFNGETLEVPCGTTIAMLLEIAEIRSRLVAVEINQDVVPREEHAARQIEPGDVIEVVTLVGGG